MALRPRLEALEDRTLLSTYLVTNTGDNGGVNPAVGAGTGTLRQAIVDANYYNTGTAANPDVIQFALPANDPHHFYYKNDGVAGHVSLANVAATTATDDSTISDIDPDWTHSWWSIQPAAGLPALTDIAVIDGYSQAGASQNTLANGDNAVLKIVLDGSQAGVVAGLVLGGGGNITVRGLVIDNFASGGALGMNTSGNLVVGNLLGTDVSGEIAAANNEGIRINSGSGDTIGGMTAAARNVISGNGTGINIPFPEAVGVVIQGNYIGTDLTGTKAVANNTGVSLGVGNTLGGLNPGDGNLISGNNNGISLSGNDVVQGNLIGTDRTGTQELLNPYAGIVASGNNNLIGGLDTNAPGAPLAGAGNVIVPPAHGDAPAIWIVNGSGNMIEGNYIGTDITGTQVLGNDPAVGFGLGSGGASGNTVGGTTAAARNVIASTYIDPTIEFEGTATSLCSNNVVEGNYIGIDATGSKLLGHGSPVVGQDMSGVLFKDYASNNTIGGTAAGAGNIIADSYEGIKTHATTGTVGNAFLGNSIFGNTDLGIELDGGNDNQAAPVLTSATSSSSGTTITGTLQSVAGTTFRIEFFANPAADPSGYGEGKTFLGYVNVTTDSTTGIANIPPTLLPALPAGQTVLSATATKLVGTGLTPNDTSQFSHDVSIPSVGPITAPLAPVAINTTVNASASFTDAIASNTHTAVWNWGDGSTSNGTVSESNGAGTVTGSHAYTVDGVYTVTLTVTNNQGGSGQSVFNYVVVYNPSAGFVTGGGWFNSPAGAYAANPTLTGQANFGLNAKYKSGSTVPTGNTDFQFPAANLNFNSTSYDWLVINGNQAQYQGSGTINGAGNYGFLVTALDNGGGATPDDLRIKIWDKNNNNAVIYDTQPGAANTAAPTTPLGGGRIQVHTNAQTASVIRSSGGSPASSTVVTDSVLTNLTPTPAASVGSASSNATGWSALQASWLGTIERDLSQWEDAMTKEMASLIQTVDQLFVELSADIRAGESTVAPLA